MYVGCVDGRGVGVAWMVGSSVPGCDVGSPDAGRTAIVGSLGWDSSIARRVSVGVPQRGQAALRGGSCRPQLPQKAIYPSLQSSSFLVRFTSYIILHEYTGYPVCRCVVWPAAPFFPFTCKGAIDCVCRVAVFLRRRSVGLPVPCMISSPVGCGTGCRAT